MTPVFVSGHFDDIRSRHLRFLEEASRFGPVTVLLSSDRVIQEQTGQPPKFPEPERLYFLRAVRYVTDVRIVETAVSGQLTAGITAPATWVMESSERTVDREAYCKAHGIECRTIDDSLLSQFPKSSFKEPEASGRKRVIVTGCYDWFHSGHVRFCEEASQFGDLYVVVGHDANIRLLKGAGRPLFPENERRYILGSIRYVKEALISSGNGWLDAEPEMQVIRPDIYAVNEDGDVPEKRDYCAKHGIEYLVLKRTPAPGLPKRSSTGLRGF